MIWPRSQLRGTATWATASSSRSSRSEKTSVRASSRAVASPFATSPDNAGCNGRDPDSRERRRRRGGRPGDLRAGAGDAAAVRGGAFAARRRAAGARAVLVMPEGAPLAKVAAVKQYGGEVRLHGGT